MARIADLGVARRLSLLVAAAVVITALVVISGILTGNTLVDHAERLAGLERGKAALNHLDTRQSELKSDAYRAALGQDMRADVTDDVASARAAADAVTATLPADLGAAFAAVRTDVDAFGTFIRDFVTSTAGSPPSAATQVGEVASRNSALDDKLDQLRGGLDASITAQRAEIAAVRSIANLVSIGSGVLGLALLVGLAIPLTRSILRPVHAVGTVVEALSRGDLSRTTGVTGKDELGRMATALDGAIAKLRGSMETIGTNASSLAGAAAELSTVSGRIADAAHGTRTQGSSASAEAEEIARNVQTIAAGSEEMGLSIREISRNTSEAAQIAAVAVAEAARATETVQSLGESSVEIGNVIKLITAIAEQTNLLALNATIEAARAGDAGKGFAVVASEVKDLAQETARATEDIGARVGAIQSDTSGAVDVISRISEVIAKINEYQTTIASAVEEQTATTQEMSRSIGEVAAGSNRIATHISDVATATGSSVTGVSQAQQTSASVARAAEELRTLVGSFRLS